MKLTSSKALRVIMAVVLAIGLTPLPAYAAPSGGEDGPSTASNDIVAGVSPALTTQDDEFQYESGSTSADDKIDLSACTPLSSIDLAYTGQAVVHPQIEVVLPNIETTALLEDGLSTTFAYYYYDETAADHKGEPVAAPVEKARYVVEVTAIDDFVGWPEFYGKLIIPFTVRDGQNLSYLKSLYVPNLYKVVLWEDGAVVPTASANYWDQESGRSVELKEGTDYDCRIVDNKYTRNPATVDKVGGYCLEMTGKGDYFGTAYLSFRVYEPYDLNMVDVSVNQYIREGDSNMCPIEQVSYNDEELKLGTDYQISYYTDPPFSGEGSAEPPTAAGWYFAKISPAPGSIYKNNFIMSYEVKSADFILPLTDRDVYVNGELLVETGLWWYSLSEVPELVYTANVDGEELEYGRDFKIVYWDANGNEVDGIQVGETIIEVVDLREGLEVESGFETSAYVYQSNDFSDYEVVDENLDLAYTGSPVSHEGRELFLSLKSNPSSTRYLFVDDSVVLSYTDSAGNPVDQPRVLGDYTCTVRASDNQSSELEGEITFDFSVREGIDLSEFRCLNSLFGEDNTYLVGDYPSPPELSSLSVFNIYNGDIMVIENETDFTYTVVGNKPSSNVVDAQEPGYYCYKLVGQGNYFNELYIEFEILDPSDLHNAVVEYTREYNLANGPVAFAPITVSMYGTLLEEGTHYEVSFYDWVVPEGETVPEFVTVDEPSMEPGEHYFEVGAIEGGGYVGWKGFEYTVTNSIDLSNAVVVYREVIQSDDTNKNPVESVTLNGSQLDPDVDYRIEYMGLNYYGEWSEYHRMPESKGSYKFRIAGVLDDDYSGYSGATSFYDYQIVQGDAIDIIMLNNAVAEGHMLLDTVGTYVYVSEDGSDVSIDDEWMTQATVDQLAANVESAEAVLNNSAATQGEIDEAYTKMVSACSTFEKQRSPGKRCTVTFDSNGGSEVASVYVQKGSAVEQPETIPTLEGYAFDSWQLDGVDYDFDTPVEGHLTLTATWAPVISVDLEVTYGQTEARTMLQMINDFRTGSDAWAWDENNERVEYSDLQPLAYDYELERVAMYRAAEIALRFDHEMLDGNSYSYSMLDENSFIAWGENLAAGQGPLGTTAAIFEGLQETDEPYSGQGHRRNMLESDFTSVGIGHVEVGGVHYWVQVFGAPQSDAPETAANDSTATVSLPISTALITETDAAASPESITLTLGESADLPVVSGSIKTADTWPRNTAVPISVDDVEWSSSDTSVATVADGKITAKKVGSASLTATFVFGEETTVTVPVTVQPQPADGVTVEFDGTYTYTGQEITPDPVVKHHDTTLVKGQDYAIEYTDNVNAGTAHATVTLAGNFTGVAYGQFTINPADVTSVEVVDSGLVYDGYAKEPTVKIMAGDLVVTKEQCYIDYENNVNAGTATVTVTVKDHRNFQGTTSATFTIDPAPLYQLVLSGDTFEYQRAPIVPDVTVRMANGIDVPSNGYTVECTNNENAGQATIKVTGNGNYTDSLERTFTIEPAQINGISIYDGTHVYDGTEQTVAIASIVAGPVELNKDEYTVSYANNVNAGTATLTATAANPNFTGSASINFTIDRKPIDSLVVKEGTYVYTGQEIKPDVTVKAGDHELAKGEYMISYQSNVDAGTDTAKVIVSGLGNYNGTLNATFSIEPAALTDATLEYETTVYDGTEKKPAVIAVKAGDLAVPADAYDVAYDENVHAFGDPTATITAKAGGNYTGSVVKRFAIDQVPITAIELDQTEFVYDGTEKKPAVTAVKAGDLVVPEYAYEFDYADNRDAYGQPMVWVGVKDGQDFSGELTQNFTIKPATITDFKLAQSEVTYTGKAIEPAVSNVVAGELSLTTNDYIVSYSNNTEVGTATATVSGLPKDGNFAGEVQKQFKIVAPSTSIEVGNGNDDVKVKQVVAETTALVDEAPAGGTVELRVEAEDEQTTSEIAELVGADSAEVDMFTAVDVKLVKMPGEEEVENVGDLKLRFNVGLEYEGRTAAVYHIHDGAVVDGDTTYQEVTGGSVSIEVNELSDFGIMIMKPGFAFDISQATIEWTDDVSAIVYNGAEQKPAFKVTFSDGKPLKEGTDYTVKWSGNKDAGTATVGITGKGIYTGEKTANFTIAKAKLASLTLTPNTYVSDGTPRNPVVTVTGEDGSVLEYGTDYDLVIPNGRAAAGTYTFKATGKGNYTGTVIAPLKVTPAPTPPGVGVARQHRLWGQKALDTMSAIVDAGSFPTGGTVVLTTDAGYWDALTAAGIAGIEDAPVLMTDGSSLSSQTRAQIAKLRPAKIVVCGGELAVEPAVASAAVAAAGGKAKLVRCSGQTATGTACDIFKKAGKNWSNTAFICTNEGYWDALAAAPVSYAKRMPIFLTEGKDRLSAESISTMKGGGVQFAYIVGGELAIYPAVQRQLESNGIKVLGRLWGYSAVETSEAVAQFGVDKMGMSADWMGVATTGGYWDALSGAALCGRKGSVLVLAANESSHSISGFVRSQANQIADFYIFGGEMVVTRATENALLKAAK